MTVGRNEPCPCGSGKRYKDCCGRLDAPPADAAPPEVNAIPALLTAAVARFEAQDWAGAESRSRELLALAPQHPEAHYVLGMVHMQTGRLAEAAAHFRTAIQHHAGPAPRWHFSLGIVLHHLGDRGGAIAEYRQAVALKPDFFDAWCNLGADLQEQGELAEAERCLRHALTLPGDALFPLCNLGITLLKQARVDAALGLLTEAVARFPEHPVLLVNHAVAQRLRGHFGEAIAQCRRALALDPAFAMAKNNLADALLASGQVEAALGVYRELIAQQPQDAAAFSNYLLARQYYDGDRVNLLSGHQQFAARYEAPLRPQWRPHGNDRTPGRRLRIGYVSADFREHAIAFFIEPILAAHDRGRFEIFCYHSNPLSDAATARLRALAAHWRPCAALGDAELADLVRADGIDILIDLSGHTAGHRLLTFARKPAPVQATWLGYPGTTGLAAMDYRLTDALLDPPGLAEAQHTETLIRLPASASFRPAADSPLPGPLPQRRNGHLTLACLNNLAKINAATIAVWARVLAGLPGARLLIGNADDPATREHLLAQFAAAGIAPERLELLPRLPLRDYLALHQRIDLALDTFPYTGGTTTCHSLAMGVPVVTRRGGSTASRQSAAVLHALGLPQLITDSEDDFVNRTLALARDPDALDTLRRTLPGLLRNAGPAEPHALTRALEDACVAMWEKWCVTASGQETSPA